MTPSYGDLSRTKAMVLSGCLAAAGVAIGLLESQAGGALLPGVRLGLSNIVIVAALVLMGPFWALGVGVVRVVMVSLLTGSFGGPGFVLAAAGMLAAWGAMSLVVALARGATEIGVSATGSFVHVAAQLAVIALLSRSTAPLALAGPYGLVALVCGVAVGLVARLLLLRVPGIVPVVHGRQRVDGAA